MTFSRKTRDLHASPKHEIADSLAKFTGIIIAMGSSMKPMIRNLLAATLLVVASLQIHAQGFIYDQDSSTGPVGIAGNGNADGLNLQKDSPLMQSFIPSLSAIGFVQLELWDVPASDNKAATFYVNLYEGGTDIDLDTLFGTSVSINVPSGYGNGITQGVSTFDFSTAITLTPGETYYLEPVVQSSDSQWDIITIGNTYPNGQVFQFTDGLNTDFWFQEGIYAVPEPTSVPLIGVACTVAYIFRYRFKTECSSMKTVTLNLLMALCLGAASLQAHVQGQVIDQESDTSPINIQTPDVDGLFIVSEPATPLTQTFIPSLSPIDYVALEFEHGTGTATVAVNLWEGSPSITSASLLATTTAVVMPSEFQNDGLIGAGVSDFYFQNPITLTPGDTYYLEPVALSGGSQLGDCNDY